MAFFPFPLFFDSVIVMASEQLVDFAMGLANSNHSFLWVIRRDLVIGNPAILPAEFEVETKKRGFIANRCLQEEVPSHPPVGGFSAYSGRGFNYIWRAYLLDFQRSACHSLQTNK